MTIYELQNILSQYGLYVLVGLVFAEYLSIPKFPRGIAIPLVGVFARMGIFSTEYGFIGALAASVVASLLVYALGYLVPQPAMRFYSSRQKGIERFQNVEKMLKRYGKLTLLRCRLYSVYRTFVSIPAGILRMNFVGYFLSTVVGNGLHILAVAGFFNLLTMLIL